MPLDLDVVPRDLEHAIALLFAGLDSTIYEFIEANPPAAIHHSMGRWLRNNWSLWDQETPLVKWFQENLQLGHADDISGIILEGLWAKVLGREHDVEATVRRYHAHWAKYGVDPITGENLGESDGI